MVNMEIFNQMGQVVEVVVNEQQASGNHQVRWNAEGMPDGIYYYSLIAGNQVSSGKLILLK